MWLQFMLVLTVEVGYQQDIHCLIEETILYSAIEITPKKKSHKYWIPTPAIRWCLKTPINTSVVTLSGYLATTFV